MRVTAEQFADALSLISQHIDVLASDRPQAEIDAALEVLSSGHVAIDALERQIKTLTEFESDTVQTLKRQLGSYRRALNAALEA